MWAGLVAIFRFSNHSFQKVPNSKESQHLLAFFVFSAVF